MNLSRLINLINNDKGISPNLFSIGSIFHLLLQGERLQRKTRTLLSDVQVNWSIFHVSLGFHAHGQSEKMNDE
jgi:hypothetical protein